MMNFAQSPVLSWGTFDPDYRAVLEKGISLGYTIPSFGYQLRGNRLVKMLKQYSIWSTLDTFYVFATDGDSDFATINWADPNNHQITKVNSPTFTSLAGFSTDGSTSYLNTNWTPSHGPKFLQNDAVFGTWIHTGGDTGATARALCGVINTGATIQVLLTEQSSGNIASRINETTLSAFTSSTSFASNSSYWVSRTASNAFTNIANGVSDGSFSTVSAGLNTQNLYILCRNNNGTAQSFGLSTWIVGIFFTGGTGWASANMHLAMREYMT